MSDFLQKRVSWILLAFLLLMLLVGCEGDYTVLLDNLPFRNIPQTEHTAAPKTSDGKTVTPTIEATPEATPTYSGPQELVVWVPPQFAPDNGSQAGRSLEQRIRLFSVDNPGVSVNTRVKAASGSNGLIESLIITSQAAPEAMPSLIALPREDLETAALKGLAIAMDDYSSIIDETDWYRYAQEMAIIDGRTYGFPFAGDALIMVYRPAKTGIITSNWEQVFSKGQSIIFPAANPKAFLGLTLYMSAGGNVIDTQKSAIIDEEPMLQVLELLDDGNQNGIFPVWLTEYSTMTEAWEAYQERSSAGVVTWSSQYFAELPADSMAMMLPSMGEEPYTLADGWVWVVTEPQPELVENSAKLAEYLVDSDFLMEWIPETAYLPTRPTTLNGWSNQTVRSLISQMVVSAQVQPSNSTIATLGPIFSDAVESILKQETSPDQAVQDALELLELPVTR